MKKYKVSFQGFVYVEAESEDEAIVQYSHNNVIYDVIEVVDTVEIDDLEVEKLKLRKEFNNGLVEKLR